MRSKNVRLVIFVGACLILLGVIFFKNNVVGDKFAQANALMSRLQSSALYTDTLTDSELALLKTTREESQARITLLTTTINSDTTRAKGMIAEVALQTAILDNFTLKAPRSYFINNVDNKLGILSTNTELKTLLDSINKQVNDRNIRESFIAWYDEFFATVCTTTDPTNDITVKGTVTFQNGSPASTDTCQGAVLVQTQCVNKQNIGTTQTNCPNGCSDGVCLNAPVNTLKGFTITAAETVLVNTSTNISISAIKNDNSVDTAYNKQVIILVDGDPNATFPLTAQTLVNGTLSIDNALKFKKVGNVTVTVKDLETGTESSKNIIVTEIATVSNNQNNNSIAQDAAAQAAATQAAQDAAAQAAATQAAQDAAAQAAADKIAAEKAIADAAAAQAAAEKAIADRLAACPTYSSPAANFCTGGQITEGGNDANGCQLPATCGPKLLTGSVTITDFKDCWFGDTTKKITLGDLLSYQATPGTNSGLIYLDEVVLYGTTPPAADEQMTNILSYEESSWMSGNTLVPNNTQLTNFFVFRTNSTGTRTWNIPANIKFYGCFSSGDRPTTW